MSCNCCTTIPCCCVPSGCSTITTLDSDSVDLSLIECKLQAVVRFSNDEGNILEDRSNGLFVPESELSLSVSDTASIDLTLTGNNLSADAIISATSGNQVSIAGDGLLVPKAAGLTVSDTVSVDLTLTAGDLSAAVIISPDGGNALSQHGNGLYVTSGGGGSGIPDDGWIDATADTWAYFAPTLIDVPDSSIFGIGDRLRVVQGGVTKYYFVIELVSATRIRIVGDLSKPLTNVLITDNFYSHVASPVGLPTYFEWDAVASANGAMTVPAQSAFQQYYTITGNVCFFTVGTNFTLGGTAANTVFIKIPTFEVTTQAPFPALGYSALAIIKEHLSANAAVGYWGIEQVGDYLFSVVKDPYSTPNWTLGNGTEIVINGSYIFGDA